MVCLKGEVKEPHFSLFSPNPTACHLHKAPRTLSNRTPRSRLLNPGTCCWKHTISPWFPFPSWASEVTSPSSGCSLGLEKPFSSFSICFILQGSNELPTSFWNNNWNQVPRTSIYVIVWNPFHSSPAFSSSCVYVNLGPALLPEAAAENSLQARTMVGHACLFAPLALCINLCIITDFTLLHS